MLGVVFEGEGKISRDFSLRMHDFLMLGISVVLGRYY